tara:strand:- start:672 stop:1040 length:369 start_codon:yes stop_codon:yes gene_type:complete
MAVTLCTADNVRDEAGSGRETTDMDTAAIEAFINHAEAYIMALTGVDYVTSYSGLGTVTKLILNETAAVKAAMKVVKYDMQGYEGGLANAQSLLDMLYTIFSDNIKLLLEKKNSDFINGNSS